MEHVERSWPDHLLQLVQDDEASESDIRRLIRTRCGGHSHEPIVARVLEKAASANKLKIVEDHLKDKVHPDVRVIHKDRTAISSSNLLPKMQNLLFRHGAKEYSPTPRLGVWGNDPDKQRANKETEQRQDRPSNTADSRDDPSKTSDKDRKSVV